MAPVAAARRRRSTIPYFAGALILSLLIILLRQFPGGSLTAASLNLTSQRCNLTSALGEWIRSPDPITPRYSPACKEIFKGWSCAAKSNRDDLSRWIWRPNGCRDSMPRFDPIRFLNRFRDRNVGFVGDSLNRNMFVSMVCMLRHVAEGGVRKWRPAGADRGFTFEKYNLTVAYHRTNLLASYAIGGPIPSLKKGLPKFISDAEDLTFTHYSRTCPHFEAIVHKKVKDWIAKDYTLAASLIRLHFHDCAVRGCDASVLLNHRGSERRAKASETLRGFHVIDDIKAELEKKCPKTVSCTDILTAAARDATVKIGGPFWEVAYGRKDGVVSLMKEAELVPMGRENVTYLIEFFQSKGLNMLDLVVLSGAHTIGRSQCAVIQNRLYNFKGTGKPDPSIDAKYLNFLKRKCRWATEYVDFDAKTPTKFDSMYYKNLQKKMGLLSTDQLLNSDSRTAPIVAALASQPMLFHQQFAVSMVNLGNAQLLTGDDEGEIRTNCNFVNP